MSETARASQRLNALALEWANGRHFHDVLWDAYGYGYIDGAEQGEQGARDLLERE